jgi:hypothetical protein
MLHEESVKNPVWKRRQHRALPPLGESEAIALFDGLYLSYLSYVETCRDVDAGLRAFYNHSWVLVNCTTAGQPLQPAHFLAVKRQGRGPRRVSPSLWPNWPIFGSGGKTELEIVLVIRGTKELGDAFSDALLQPAAYRDGVAHDGIRQSAVWIKELYRDWILQLKRESRSTHVKVWVVGHSLGYVGRRNRYSNQSYRKPSLANFRLSEQSRYCRAGEHGV